MLLNRLQAKAATGTPIGPELSPDVGLDVAQPSTWTLTGGAAKNASSVSINGISWVQLGGSDAVNNTTGQNFTAGTYRFTCTIANYVSNGLVRPNVGTAISNVAGPTANGVYTVDVVAATDQPNGSFGFRSTVSTNVFDITDMSVKRIA